MLQTLGCARTEHQWSEETVSFQDDQYYGTGQMRQRRCRRCTDVEYIRFVSDQGVVTEIEKPLVAAGLRGAKIGDNIVESISIVPTTFDYEVVELPPAQYMAGPYTLTFTRTVDGPPEGLAKPFYGVEPE